MIPRRCRNSVKTAERLLNREQSSAQDAEAGWEPRRDSREERAVRQEPDGREVLIMDRETVNMRSRRGQQLYGSGRRFHGRNGTAGWKKDNGGFFRRYDQGNGGRKRIFRSGNSRNV